MIGFEVNVNEGRVCTAGIDAPGDMQINLIWVLRHSQEDLTGTPGTSDESVGLSVHGKAYAVAEYLAWPYTALEVGDEITIRVVNRDSFDAPARRTIESREKQEQYLREMYQRLKARYELASQA